MHANIENLAIVVHTCDDYSFLYQGLHFLFDKFFQHNLTSYFLTEEIKTQFKDFQTINTGKGPWANRLKAGLNQIPHQNIIYLQEDFWLIENINFEIIKQFYHLFLRHNLKLLKLYTAADYQYQNILAEIAGFPAYQLDKQSGFLMFHQLTIWNKAFLIEQLRNNEHTWRNEQRGTKRLRKSKETIATIPYFLINNDSLSSAIVCLICNYSNHPLFCH